MCRIALLRNAGDAVALQLAQLQSHGANRRATFWQSDALTFVHSRFDVTTKEFADSDFPLRNDRYVVHFNGEVYGYKDEDFTSQAGAPSDVHYCLTLLQRHGVEGFLREADIQGTFQIYDRLSNTSYIAADQLNSAGSFYAKFKDTIVAAQEVSLVHSALEQLRAPADVPIKVLGNGCFLRIGKSGATEEIEYRPDCRRVYSGEELSVQAVEEILDRLQSALVDAVLRRLPKDGPIPVLASGGVDSSVVLAIIATHLRAVGDLDRLRVVTFGRPDLPGPAENDFLNSLHLIEALGLSPREHFLQINEDLMAREALYVRHVFCDHPRLITPNPILNSQVRHTVRMSLVLSDLARMCPDAKVVITGDVADELFAGYHSMRVGVQNGHQLRDRVREKLADLTLNDSARYTLASLYGCSAAISESSPISYSKVRGHACGSLLTPVDGRPNNRIPPGFAPDIKFLIETAHPIEVRTPFSSHLVLRALRDAHPDSLVGSFGDKVTSKFLLRLVAHRCGVPTEIASRKKIPFNEGGSGIRNEDRDGLEEAIARSWRRYEEKDLIQLIQDDREILVQLNLMQEDEIDACETLSTHYEQIAVYAAAKLCGLSRLVRGGVFRSQMPDSVYASEEYATAYQPLEMLRYDPHADRLELTSGSRLERIYV
ncbi:MAG TPA: asparagine synthase-related protein [Terracidiphilus sp.]|nr:asparagine synthase-related protein [Terracidiphilus sp.]